MDRLECLNKELTDFKKKQIDRLEFLNKELGSNYKSLDEVNWDNISDYQKLSENFIREF